MRHLVRQQLSYPHQLALAVVSLFNGISIKLFLFYFALKAFSNPKQQGPGLTDSKQLHKALNP